MIGNLWIKNVDEQEYERAKNDTNCSSLGSIGDTIVHHERVLELSDDEICDQFKDAHPEIAWLSVTRRYNCSNVEYMVSMRFEGGDMQHVHNTKDLVKTLWEIKRRCKFDGENNAKS